MIKLNRIRNLGSLRDTNMTEKIRVNGLRRFGCVERKNNDEVVKKIGDIRVEKNRREECKLKYEWVRRLSRTIRGHVE